MRPRKGAERLLQRSEDEWSALGERDGSINFAMAVPVWAATRLISLGALNPAEEQLLRDIAAGTIAHPRIEADRARELVADIDKAASA